MLNSIFGLTGYVDSGKEDDLFNGFYGNFPEYLLLFEYLKIFRVCF